MPRTRDEQAAIERFDTLYAHARDDFMREIERSVCGCDYGGTSWTTRAEADKVTKKLALAPGRRLLEVGAGSGWPGLYLAKQTGCDVALIDLPIEGLRVARDRAASDRLAGTHWIAQADGTALPFGDGIFDAVFHSDVLCCLVEKLAVLKACRRVASADGRLVFSVVYVTPGLDTNAHALAIAGGPPFVDASHPYPDLVRQAGWTLVNDHDLTDEYLQSTRRHLTGLETHRSEIAATFGVQDAADMVTKRRATVHALEAGTLKRALFEAVPAAAS